MSIHVIFFGKRVGARCGILNIIIYMMKTALMLISCEQIASKMLPLYRN